MVRPPEAFRELMDRSSAHFLSSHPFLASLLAWAGLKKAQMSGAWRRLKEPDGAQSVSESAERRNQDSEGPAQNLLTSSDTF